MFVVFTVFVSDRIFGRDVFRDTASCNSTIKIIIDAILLRAFSCIILVGCRKNRWKSYGGIYRGNVWNDALEMCEMVKLINWTLSFSIIKYSSMCSKYTFCESFEYKTFKGDTNINIFLDYWNRLIDQNQSDWLLPFVVRFIMFVSI